MTARTSSIAGLAAAAALLAASPARAGLGDGIRLGSGEGVLHPFVELTARYDSNVYTVGADAAAGELLEQRHQVHRREGGAAGVLVLREGRTTGIMDCLLAVRQLGVTDVEVDSRQRPGTRYRLWCRAMRGFAETAGPAGIRLAGGIVKSGKNAACACDNRFIIKLIYYKNCTIARRCCKK